VTLVHFEKYEGLGNDFLVVDEREGEVLDLPAVSGICDRHFGVGGDGILLVQPPRTEGAVATMVVRNADGTRPEMCGNGLRCVAAFLVGRHVDEAIVVVDTDAGPRSCRVLGDQVEVAMGQARLDGEITVEHDGESFVFDRISMGNPHAVTFFDKLPDQAFFHTHGPDLATHPAFPEGANIELCALQSETDGDAGPTIDVLVWERGVGPTLACGSGACAVAVHAAKAGLVPFDVPVTVRLPGGALVITVSPALAVTMRGPARFVFRGEVQTP
jgi:diaminopimelate epimerase